MSNNSRATLYSVQYPCGLAALAVVAHHTAWTHTQIGQAGVDLFFVISGFIMVHVSRREPSPTAFLRARAVRVVPLCWLATLLAALTATWTAQKRLWRDALLSASDGTFASDRTVSEATKQAWAAYRKAPRDLPTTPCFPANTNWPTPPASVK